jgi:hypothetical protein
MLYLYAIIEPGCAPLDPPLGFEDVALEIVPFGAFSLVTGALAEAPPREEATILLHMEVLTALMRRCTMLPVRFGTVFPSFEELARAMNEIEASISADLQRVRGMLEFGLTVTQRGAPPIPVVLPRAADIGASCDQPGPGLRSIAAKRAEHEQREQEMLENEQLAARSCTPFLALVSEHVWRALPALAGRGVAVALLLPAARLEAFHLALAELILAAPDLKILCTGPWPPFTFVGDGARTFAERSADGGIAGQIAQ